MLSTRNAYIDSDQENIFKDTNIYHKTGFRQIDIHQIFSTCYNSGVTLVELGQPDLAEKFMSKAIAFLPYTSSDMQSNWKQSVDVS